MPEPLIYIPGIVSEKPFPLSRFLPPIPEGVAGNWLMQRLPPGGWVLDPFGAAPRLVIETARLGYRVLVAANNPITRFLIEQTANPPLQSDLRTALADISSSFKGEERIEPLLRSLYLTECAQCGREVTAEAFLWERDAPCPYGRIYHCPTCGDSGEHPATQKDADRATRFRETGLHRARALERVATPDDPDRTHVIEALEVYLPRAIYALFTLLNKLDSLPPGRRSLYHALLLPTFDQANTLWQHPTARARPRQLTVPPRFRENNVWMALEGAVDLWAGLEDHKIVPVTTWPLEPPATGGICLYEGRLKDLSESLNQIKLGAVLTALPRPNQAFWTLSALWAGWLWGREASTPIKSVLRRRRYDWAWHASALNSTLSHLFAHLEPSVPVLGLIVEAEAGFLSAALLSACLAGFQMVGLALCAEEGQAQIIWQKQVSPVETPEVEKNHPLLNELEDGEKSTQWSNNLQAVSLGAAREYLSQRGEPADYLPLHVAALSALVQPSESRQIPLLVNQPDQESSDLLTQVHAAFQHTFTYRNGFIRYGGSEHTLEIGQWWTKEKSAQLPLADRVEMTAVQALFKQPGISWLELDTLCCTAFPGLLTPEPTLIQACLESYGEQLSSEDNRWQLRSQDLPKNRRQDLVSMKNLLLQTGAKIGFICAESLPEQKSETNPAQLPIIWRDSQDEVKYVFFVLASAVIGRIILLRKFPPQQTILVYPAGRASLILYKLRADPRLRLEFENGFRLLKFRHLRRLAENPNLTSENLDDQLALDPIGSADPQMTLL